MKMVSFLLADMISGLHLPGLAMHSDAPGTCQAVKYVVINRHEA
jgi:hypothetical protein